MRKGLVIVIGLIVGYAISWAFTVGIIKLITMCFPSGFLCLPPLEYADSVAAEICFS